MQNFESVVSILQNLLAGISDQPGFIAGIGIIIGVLITLLLSSALGNRRPDQDNSSQHEDTDQRLHRLNRTLLLKNRQLSTMEQTCKDQETELTNTKKQIQQFEQATQITQVAEGSIEQQLKQIETLTDNIEFELGLSLPQGLSPSSDATGTDQGLDVDQESKSDQLALKLYEKLSALHEHIADQARLISSLQSELQIKEEEAKLQVSNIVDEPQPAEANNFSEKLIEPLQHTALAVKQKMQSVPDQARAILDEHIIAPVNHRFSEVKEELNQKPVPGSEQLTKIVVDPLQKFFQKLNPN